MSDLDWFLLGSIVGFVSNLISSALFPRIQTQYRRLVLKISAKRGRPAILGPIPMNERLSVAGIVTDMVVLSWAHYVPGRLQCSYDDRPIPFPSDILRLKNEFISDWKEKEASGESRLPFNSPTYKLKSFDVTHREIIDGEEIPVLYLDFGPTDYFTHCITDLNVRNPIRDRYAKTTDIMIKPVAEFATTLGINLNLITQDGYLIMTERSLKTQTEPGTLHTSVGEGLFRPTDSGPNGAPDPFRCALRGTQEELGVVLKLEEVEFNAFCVHAERCQYSLFGWSRIKETKADVILLRSLAVPKDKWENRSLIFVPCNPDSIARFMIGTWDRWSATGIASAILSLLQAGHSAQEIHNAFSLARSTAISH